MSITEGDPAIWASVTTIAEYVEYTEEDNISITVNVTKDQGPHPFGSHPVWAAILIILVGATLSIFTVTANAMVFLSFYMDKQLQVVNNYFLLSLAVADIIIGAISMPLYTLYLLQEGWRLGPIVCDIWLSIDYAASNASVMNLCIICFDRYFSITRPLTYRANRTPRKAKIMIACAWLLSIFIWIPLIIGWQFFPFVNERTVPAGQCYIQFLWDNISLNVITILIAFYVPVSLMCTLYYRIWRETENRAKELGHLQEGSQISTNGTGKHMLSHDDSIDQMDERRDSISWFNRCICCAIAAIGPEDDMEDSSDVVSPQPSTNTTHTSSTKSRNGVQSHLCNSASSPKNSPRLSPPARHKRAASSGAAVPHHSDKSFAASLYTILIKLPDDHSPDSEHEKLPSITLIEGAPKTDAEMMQDPEGSHLVPPSGNHTTLPRARSDSVCSGTHAPRRGSTTRLGAVRGGHGGPLSISTISMVNKMASRAKTNVVKKRKSAIIREKKAARTLCAILSAFIITWTPYSILVLITLKYNSSTTEMIFNISYWLCYLNSTINPICYALCNTNFRRAFKRILTCKWKLQARYQGAHRKVRHMPSPSRQSER